MAWTKENDTGVTVREIWAGRDEERDVGEGEARRKKQTPNSLFSLSNSGGVRTEGRGRGA